MDFSLRATFVWFRRLCIVEKSLGREGCVGRVVVRKAGLRRRSRVPGPDLGSRSRPSSRSSRSRPSAVRGPLNVIRGVLQHWKELPAPPNAAIVKAIRYRVKTMQRRWAGDQYGPQVLKLGGEPLEEVKR